MANKAIKYRLYPTDEQRIMFAKTFGCCRKVYNLMLADKIKCYDETKEFGKQTPAMYKDEYPYLKEVDSLALANVQLNLQSAIKSCFDKGRKKRNRFPVFKSAKHSRRSYTTNNQNGTVGIIDNAYIRLPKIGNVKAVIHREPEDGWVLKSATVSQDSAGRYFASVLFVYDASIESIPLSNNVIGLDYSSAHLYMDDRGNRGTNHKYFKESQEKLAREQRRLSRRKGARKGEEKSRNYNKQYLKVNKIHRHIANQRLDNLHKTSTAIAKQYDVVCVESLNMKAISNKKHKNGKATMDNGYGIFLNMLRYKLEDRGKYFIKVPWNYASSQICHNCGCVHSEMKDLKNRTIECNCGLKMDRDQNAAINIRNEGLRLLREA